MAFLFLGVDGAATGISDQTVYFGSLTPETTGGAQAKANDGTYIDFTSVSGGDGNWEISGGRLRRATGGGTPAARHGDTLTCGTSLGSITVTINSTGTDGYGRSMLGNYSFASTTEFASIVPNSAGTETAISGKTMFFRPGLYTSPLNILASSWTGSPASPCTITSHDKTVRAHFDYDNNVYGSIWTNAASNIILDNLDVSKENQDNVQCYTIDVDNTSSDITINECEIWGNPSPASGLSCNGVGGAAANNFTVTNSELYDFLNCIKLSAPTGDITITGNYIRRHQGDGINLNRGSGTVLGTSTVISMNTFADATNPDPGPLGGHSDAIQITHNPSPTQAFTGLEIEENIFFYNDQNIQVQLIFLEASNGTYPYKDFKINRNVGIGNTVWGIGIGSADGGYITNNTMLHMGTATVFDAQVSIYVQSAADSGGANTKVYGNIAEAIIDEYPTSIDSSANVVLGKRGVTKSYNDVMVGPWDSAGPQSRAELLEWAAIKFTGADPAADADSSGNASIGDAGAIGSGAWTPPTTTPGTAGSARNTAYETYYDP